MDPHDQEIARAIRQYAALQESEAERNLKLSPDFTAQVLARIRRQRTTLERQNARANPERSSWIEHLRASWRPFAFGGAALAALLIFLGMQGYLDSGNSYVGQSDPAELRGASNPMPRRLNVDFRLLTITLRDRGIEMRGAITPLPSESSTGTNVYRLDASGKDSEGKITSITNGRAVLLLKNPDVVPKDKGDTTEIRLEGRLDVAGQGNYSARRTYRP